MRLFECCGATIDLEKVSAVSVIRPVAEYDGRSGQEITNGFTFYVSLWGCSIFLEQKTNDPGIASSTGDRTALAFSKISAERAKLLAEWRKRDGS